MLVGHGRAGKTSTAKTLLRKPFDHKEASTAGMDMKECQISRLDATNWEESAKEAAGSRLEAVDVLAQVLAAKRLASASPGSSSCDAKLEHAEEPLEDSVRQRIP